MALKPEIKRWFPETGFVVFFQALFEGKLVARCLNLAKFSTQTFHKCSRKTQNDGTAHRMMIRLNRNFTFFSLQIYSRVSRVMRAITGFITTHLPGVAAPAPLIHNLKRSQKIFQGGLYRIHLMWQNKNGDLVAGKDCSTVCEEHPILHLNWHQL